MVFGIHWHESAMDLHVFPLPIPPPTSHSIPTLWLFPVHQPGACIQPGRVICFTHDSILVSMLFSWNIPPSPSPTESKSLFHTSVWPFFKLQKRPKQISKIQISKLALSLTNFAHIVLSWPKSSFVRVFLQSYGKTQRNFWANPIIIYFWGQ